MKTQANKKTPECSQLSNSYTKEVEKVNCRENLPGIELARNKIQLVLPAFVLHISSYQACQ